MASPEHCLAHQLRAIVFINHLVLLAGCSRTPAALECWGSAFEARVGLLGTKGWEPGKWARYLKGVLPEKKLQTALIEEFPMLEEVLHNPLWDVLRVLELSSDHGKTLVAQLRVHDKALHGLHRVRLQRRITTADWQDLGFWLVILAGDLDKYRWAREFVQERFSIYLHLICVQREFAGVTKWLYPLLDYHFREGHLPLIAGWPDSAEAFAKQIHALHLLPRAMMQFAHIEGELEFALLCADPDGFEATSFGYGGYWDADWNRRLLTSKEKRYLSPPLEISLEGLPADGKRQRRRASEKRVV